jgi:hypothetical protein
MRFSRSAEPSPDDAGRSAGCARDSAGTARSLETAPDLPTLVAFINAQHGTTFRIGERYLHGEQGAVALYNASGARFVLKWTPGARDLSRVRETVRIVDRLRSRWYPVPRFVAMGVHPGGRYVIQTALPGAPVERLSASQVGQIIALNDIQRELASPEAEAWPACVVDDVLEGGDGYCLLEPMRRHAPMTAQLLDLVQALVARHRNVTTPTTDIVHFDFRPSNILGLAGKISGVVDWGGDLAGDRSFDLVTLLFYAYDQETARDALWGRITAITDPIAAAVYLAHLIHRQVDWSIRHHAPATIDHWLERARLVLLDIPLKTGCAVSAWP